MQMLDVSFPTLDGRRLVMPRDTELDPEQALLLHPLKFVLPQTAASAHHSCCLVSSSRALTSHASGERWSGLRR